MPNEVPETRRKPLMAPLHPSDVVADFVTQRMVKDLVIKVGNIADRPSTGGTHIRAFWAEDESKLYIWNTVNEAWESTTLS